MAGPSVVVRVLGDVKGLGDSFSDASKKAESAGSKIHGAFSSVLGTLNKTGVLGPFGEALAVADESLSNLKDSGKDLGKTMLGVGATMVGVGASLTGFGSKEKAATQQLGAAVEATGHSYEQYKTRIDKAVKSQEKYGHSATDTKGALQKLTQATHDPAKALDLLATASDLAAAKHEDLSTAAQQVGLAYNGNQKILKQFGIEIDKATGKTKDGKTATQALADVLKGQAAAASDTFTGKLKGIATAVEDQVSLFGQKYGPAITAAGAAVTGLGGVIEIASNAQEIWNAVMALTEGLELATLGPILLIVAAVAALALGIYELVKHWNEVWGEIKAAALAVWNWFKSTWVTIKDVVKDAVNKVIDWLKANWKVLLIAALSGPFALAVLVIGTQFDKIETAAKDIIPKIKAAFTGIGSDIAAFFEDAWAKIKDGAGAAVDALIGSFTGVGSKITDKVGDIWGDVTAGAKGAVSGVTNAASGIGSGIKDAAKGAFDPLSDEARKAGKVISSIWGDVKTQAQGAANFIKSAFTGVWDGLKAGARAVGDVFKSAFSGLQSVVDKVSSVLDVGSLWSGASAGLKDAYKFIVSMWDNIIGYVRGVPDRLKAVLGGLWNVIGDKLHAAYQAVVGLVEGIIGYVRGIPGRIAGALGDPWHRLVTGALGAYNEVRHQVDRIVNYVGSIPGKIGAIGGRVWNGFRGMYNHVASAWNGLHFSLPRIDVGPIHFGGQTFGVPHIPLLAQGGLITKEGLIYAHAGEAITPAPGRTGPAIAIEHLELGDGLDVETFMRKAAWVVATEGV